MRPAGSPVSSEFLSLPGAVDSSDEDRGVPAHYGNPLMEQRRLAGGAAIVDLSHRSVLSVQGPDRLTWLNSITSQSLDSLEPGSSTETLVLDPTGHIEFAVRLLDDGVVTWLLLERDEAPGLLAWLTSMKFSLRVELADRTVAFATIGTLGTPLLPSATPNGVPLIWRDPWPIVSPGGYQYAAAAGHPASSWTYSEVLVARADLAMIAGSDIPVAGIMALEALRIAAWRPRLAAEADAKTIPHELDWLRSAVHLNKGCYRGQETVAKVHNLGHPPRRLVMLQLDGSEAILPARGDQVLLAGTLVGRVTSAARHFEFGPIALAVIKRSVAVTASLSVRSGGVDL
ncbi:MAG: CAF17-like 4Fe-4S cluster assembly/insertion protein YgfZ, partial [Microbacteriaceae bacterium]